MKKTILAALLGCVLWSGAALAGDGYDLIFRTGTLDAFAPGDRLEYRSHVARDDAPDAAEDALLELALAEEGTAARLRRMEDGQARPVAEFDASVGNPMAMFFLERTVRDVAEATGGSPFYIRNRIKDSLLTPRSIEATQVTWNGAAHAGQTVTLMPFAQDKNRARLGEFADMEIAVTVSPDVPGWYSGFIARTPVREGAGRFFVSELSLAEVRK
ncbi:hypothetical protein DDZ14_13560 [Maritimibacter sp. 55A14]|uniref:hypothetical protein n=1 Tax=Maritimibacter sp. 55A14 TaxID=2174844 RepID=UPI000D613DD6|nr:hypothetical protein [Maritimibacter sp. 55A14]PWE31214.1 hypothetical protein DDZ14_13560 [Maritimibacter sp. 55A14]